MVARVGQIDAVVVSGGEPTLQKDLDKFLHAVKQMGFAIKLDTNGCRPLVLSRLLQAGLLDYVAMDIKAPWPKYAVLIGASRAPLEGITYSIRIIRESRVAHEFRTTFVRPLLEEGDLAEIRANLPQGSVWKRQELRAGQVLDPTVFCGTKYASASALKLWPYLRGIPALEPLCPVIDLCSKTQYKRNTTRTETDS